ncbi:MAG: bifunctional riboflavin kinase/FAD synthetase [Saprospirales bacterium]|nr:MAG: bifunctional riboflavin kinase/FAD synthetase [Saprospirales bacterium]
MKVYRDIDHLPEFRKSVVTIGSFDGVHLGHKKILDRVKDYARQYKAPSIVVTFDPHPRQVIYPGDKSLELITSLREKVILFEKTGIDHLVIVPFTVEFAQLIPQEYIENFLIKRFNPYCIVIGYDHRFGLNRGGDVHMLKSYGGEHDFKVIQIPKQECDAIAVSSTKIRRFLKNKELAQANKLLGHPYFLIGEVVHGKKIGGGLGFPTANLKIRNQQKIIPPNGIYAVQVYFGDDQYGGMMYVGERPSLDDGGGRSIEVHIFDFNHYIYGESLLVEIIDFVREDEKFDDMEALKAGLRGDKASAEIILEEYRIRKKQESQYRAALALLNYNGMKHLPTFLPSVVKHCPSNCKIYLIDNNSSDDSVLWVREHHPQIEVIELLDNRGYAGGYNKGLQLIREKYLVLINTDVAFSNDWLSPALDYLDENPQVGAIQPKVLSYKEPDKFEYAGASGGFMDILSYPFCRGRIFHHSEVDEGQYDDKIEIFWASGAAFVVRNELFTQSGGFDDSYFAHMEEIDLCWRLKKAGYLIECLPQHKVYHLGGGTLDYDNPRKTYLNFRNNLFTILKNENKRRLVWMLPTRLLLDVAASFKFLLQGKTPLFMQVWRAKWHVFRNLPRLTLARRRFNKKIVAMKKGRSRTRYGRYYYSIVWQFFIRNKRKFSDLNWKEDEAARH